MKSGIVGKNTRKQFKFMAYAPVSLYRQNGQERPGREPQRHTVYQSALK